MTLLEAILEAGTVPEKYKGKKVVPSPEHLQLLTDECVRCRTIVAKNVREYAEAGTIMPAAVAAEIEKLNQTADRCEAAWHNVTWRVAEG